MDVVKAKSRGGVKRGGFKKKGGPSRAAVTTCPLHIQRQSTSEYQCQEKATSRKGLGLYTLFVGPAWSLCEWTKEAIGLIQQ